MSSVTALYRSTDARWVLARGKVYSQSPHGSSLSLSQMVKLRTHYDRALLAHMHQVRDVNDYPQTADSSVGRITTLLSDLSPKIYCVPFELIRQISPRLSLLFLLGSHILALILRTSGLSLTAQCYIDFTGVVKHNADSGIQRAPLKPPAGGGRF